MISVVIPVYNTAQYLGRCLDSVLASTYQDFEILLIDDGSTDGSLAVCQAYAGKDGRVRVTSQRNQGVSSARNRGIAQSRGEWVVFVDSDDTISPEFLGLAARAEYQNCDLVIFDCAWTRQRGRGKTPLKEKGPPQKNQGDSFAPLVERLLRQQPLPGGCGAALPSPCGKAYRRCVLQGHLVRFPLGIPVGEDRIFNIQFFYHMGAWAYLPKAVYFAGQRMSSATHAYRPDSWPQSRRFAQALKETLEGVGLLPQLEAAYCENLLADLAALLIRGIFRPGGRRPYGEGRGLCKEIRRDPLFGRALEYSPKNGTFPRRILLRFFRWKWDLMTALICKISFFYLYRWRRI